MKVIIIPLLPFFPSFRDSTHRVDAPKGHRKKKRKRNQEKKRKDDDDDDEFSPLDGFQNQKTPLFGLSSFATTQPKFVHRAFAIGVSS